MSKVLSKKTKVISIGSVKIGGTFPVAIQSMVLSPPRQADNVLCEIKELASAGCEIVRVAVPTLADAQCLGHILSAMSAMSPKGDRIPLVADIHFDPQIALLAIEQGVDKIRLNPSNIKDPAQIKNIVKACKDRKIPIRVGANTGSLHRYESIEDAVDQLFRLVCGEVQILEELNFHDIVLSAKGSSLEINEAINRKLSSAFEYPLHIGITEAGPLIPGLIKSILGLKPLLSDGIGDTIRISLSGELAPEVLAARSLLVELGLRKGIKIVSCPMCGRSHWDVQKYATEIYRETIGLGIDSSIAIMGCEVNGPGEAREADIGLAGSGDYLVLFEKGEITAKGSKSEMLALLRKKLSSINNKA